MAPFAIFPLVVPDLAGDALSPTGLGRIASLNWATLPIVQGKPRLGPPVGGTRNFVYIGLKYADHAAETGAAIPAEPIVFLKSMSALCGPDDDILVPKESQKTDWEA